MRVVHACAYFAPAFAYGGPPRSVLGLCQALQRTGVEVSVVTTTANGAQELPAGAREYAGVPVTYLARTFPKRFFAAAGFANAVANAALNADFVHVHGLWNLSAWAAVRGAIRAGKPFAISPRGMMESAALRRRSRLKRLAFPLVERRNLARAAFLHATSDAEARTLADVRLGPPIETIPNGVETIEPDAAGGRALRARLGIPPDAPLAFYLGRLHPLKRLDLLAAAFVRVRAALPSAQLLVAGPDEAGQRAELASHFAPLGAHAHFLGEADAAGKAALFAAGWVSATTSDSESFGQSVAEALAAGVPAVVVDTCPWRQLESERCGRWVTQTPAAVAEGLLEFLSDDNRRRQAGERARRFAGRAFAWDAVAERMKSAYARFAAPARSRPA